MTFYVITFGTIDEQAHAPGDQSNGKPSIRELPAWDTRTLDEITAAYKSDGFISVSRLGTRHAPGRPLEHKGELVVFSPHLIAVAVDLKSAHAQPSGPLPFEPHQK